MMGQGTVKGHRRASAGVLVVVGAAVSAAVWAGGDHGWAIGAIAFCVVLAAVVYARAGGSGDVAAILRAGGDERQRGLDREGMTLAGYAMTAVAVIGAIVELGRTGNPGVYGLFCAVEGLAYGGSLAVLRRLR